MPSYACDDCENMLCSTCDAEVTFCECSVFVCEDCLKTHSCGVVATTPRPPKKTNMTCYCCDSCGELLCDVCDSKPKFCVDCPLFLCEKCIDDHECYCSDEDSETDEDTNEDEDEDTDKNTDEDEDTNENEDEDEDTDEDEENKDEDEENKDNV